MKKLENLTGLRLDIKLELNDDIGHSQSHVSSFRTLAESTANRSNEANTEYPKGALITEYNDIYWDNPLVYFKCPRINHDSIHKVYALQDGTKFYVPSYTKPNGRHPSNTCRFGELTSTVREWKKAFEPIVGDHASLVKEAEDREFPFSGYIDLLEEVRIITFTGKHRLGFELAGVEQVDTIKRILEYPERFVVSSGIHASFVAKPVTVSRKNTITDEMLESLKNWPRPSSLGDFKTKATSLCKNHTEEDNGDRYLLALYYIVAGLDDYDTKQVFDTIASNYQCKIRDIDSIARKIPLLQMLTNYNNNSGQYNYGRNRESDAKKVLEQLDIEEKDLYVTQFDMGKIVGAKHDINQLLQHTKNNLFSVEFEVIEEIV